MTARAHHRDKDMKKPDFDSGGVFAYGAVRLSHEERSALLDLIPQRWKSVGTQDRMRSTDSDRLLHGISEALGFFDASRARPSAAGGAVLDDILAIGKAAENLQKAIQIADSTARLEINTEAKALEFLERGRDFEERNHPILSVLWDLASDVSTSAKSAAKAIQTDADTRPDRIIPRQMAQSIVAHVARNLGRNPPSSQWFEEVVALVGSYRGVTIGKAVTRKALISNAAWLAARGPL